MMTHRIGDDHWKAGEYGTRCRLILRQLDRAMAITARQGAPCLSARDLQHLAEQAWANARLAAHHARRTA